MINQNIDTLIYNYVSHCRFEKGLNPKTLKAYQTDLTQFAQFIKGNDGGCNKENLQAYIAQLHSRYKVKSVKRKIASLKAFFTYLEYEKIVEPNPFSRIRIKLHEPFLLPRTMPPYSSRHAAPVCPGEDRGIIQMYLHPRQM